MLERVDLNKGLSVAELDALIGSRDHLPFLNSRNKLYREMNLKEDPPSRSQALQIMSENPNLIKRPLTIRGERIVAGFDEQALLDLTSD